MSAGGGVGYLVAAVVYLALVFVLSHIPGDVLDLGIDIWDKAIHFAEYVPVGFLLCGWLVHRAWASRRRLLRVLVVTLAVLALGALDEVHQMFVENRSATVGDALADGVGGLLGAIVGGLVLGGRRRE